MEIRVEKKDIQQMIEDKPPLLGMEKCRKCGRNFMADRIAKHEKACAENKKPKKVKRFVPLPPKKKKDGKKRQIWKEQHNNFM